MTARRSLTSKERLRLFALHDERCHLCGGRIGVGEAWEVEHVIPLAMGGADDDANRKPAHVKCHRAKTTDDAANIAKAKRREAKHLGARPRPKRPIPGSKASGWKKPLNGPAVRREP
jgi:5-methylcytosine-specific restriction endonuclease McrA